eukprot:Colp12_sorted_trinity150504_noHs@22887
MSAHADDQQSRSAVVAQHQETRRITAVRRAFAWTLEGEGNHVLEVHMQLAMGNLNRDIKFFYREGLDRPQNVVDEMVAEGLINVQDKELVVTHMLAAVHKV